jgi:hypothetical protein
MKQEPAKRWSSLIITLKIARPLSRQLNKAHTTQQEDEEFIQTLKRVGVPEDAIPRLLTLIDGARKARQNRIVSYRSDTIFVAGIAALNLILLQVVNFI